jgi:predicted dehydrogenase
MEAMKKANVVLIGCGNRGIGGHGRRARRSRSLELVGVCDVDEGRLAAAQQQLEVPGERDYRKLLDRADVQAVIVATTAPYHVPIALDAVRAGKHVLCEKPLAESTAAGRQLAEAAEAAGVVGMVGYQYRFTAFGTALKRVAGEVEPMQMLITRPRRPMNRQFFSPRHHDGVADHTTHDIDLALWAMSGAPEAVYGTTTRGTVLGDQTIEYLNLLVEYDGGQRTLAVQASMLGLDVPALCYVIGTYGTAWTDDRKSLRVTRHARIVEPGPQTPVPGLSAETIDTSVTGDDNQTMLDHFGDLVTGRETVQRGATLREGMHAVAITEAMVRATETGRRVPISEIL